MYRTKKVSTIVEDSNVLNVIIVFWIVKNVYNFFLFSLCFPDFYKVFSLIYFTRKICFTFPKCTWYTLPTFIHYNSSYHYFTIYIKLHFLKIPNDEIKNIHPYLFDSTLWPTISDENISIYSLNSIFHYFSLMHYSSAINFTEKPIISRIKSTK